MSGSRYDDPPRPLDTVHAVELDGELVLYSSATNRAVHLDARATLIWRVLDGNVTVAELVDDLSEVFQTDKDVVRADVDGMFTELHGLGYLAPAETSVEPAPTVGSVLPDPPSP